MTVAASLPAIEAMFEVPANDWWQFVPCVDCAAKRQEPCVMGGASWPTPAHRPHKSRRASADVMHGTLWLLANGFEADVLPLPEARP